MIDPLDKQTDPLPLGDGEAVPAASTTLPDTGAEPAPVATNVVQIQTPVLPDEDKLSKDFDLVRIKAPVYVWDKKKAAERTAGAERVEKFRKKQAAEGLRPASVPVIVLDAVKAAGGWQAWQEETAASAEAAATEKATATTAAAIEKANIAEAAEAAAKAAAQEAAAKAEAAEAAAKAATAAAPPPEIAEEVKAAGGWTEWITQKAAAAAPAPLEPKIVEKTVVKQVEVPAKLGNRDTESLAIGRKVQALMGWKAALTSWLLKP